MAAELRKRLCSSRTPPARSPERDPAEGTWTDGSIQFLEPRTRAGGLREDLPQPAPPWFKRHALRGPAIGQSMRCELDNYKIIIAMRDTSCTPSGTTETCRSDGLTSGSVAPSNRDNCQSSRSMTLSARTRIDRARCHPRFAAGTIIGIRYFTAKAMICLRWFRPLRSRASAADGGAAVGPLAVISRSRSTAPVAPLRRGRQIPALIAVFEPASAAVALQCDPEMVRPDRHAEFP